jgi:hypothetical protein
MALLCLAVAIPASDALAQQKQKISYKVTADNSKYMQQHVIDVGDMPEHQVRVYELHRTFPNNAPLINGVKLVETWGRGVTDYIDGNGPNTTYTVYVLENGDKFFTRASLISQSSGGGKITTWASGTVTGGTGKLVGIQGIVRTTGAADPKSGFNEGTTEIEYWFAK